MDEVKNIVKQEDGIQIDLEAFVLTILKSQREKGVSYQELIRYKDIFFNICSERNIKVRFGGVSKDSIKRLAIDYNNTFRIFNEHIYLYPASDTEYIFGRYPDNINYIFQEALDIFNNTDKPKTIKKVPGEAKKTK